MVSYMCFICLFVWKAGFRSVIKGKTRLGGDQTPKVRKTPPKPPLYTSLDSRYRCHHLIRDNGRAHIGGFDHHGSETHPQKSTEAKVTYLMSER
jgi:hypothetical protein